MAQENKSKSKSNSQMPGEVLQALAYAGQSKFVKFADGQTMKLHFHPDLTTVYQTTFNGKRDKPTTRFKFLITEHENPDDIPLEYQNPKEWDTGSEVAKELGGRVSSETNKTKREKQEHKVRRHKTSEISS